MGLTVSELLGRAGVRPGMAAGTATANWSSLCAAGAFGPETLLELSAGTRGGDPGRRGRGTGGPWPPWRPGH
ncbi:hypothetical protein [Streptomyces thioluteus]|uniref:hypothetical protein n=1 Tax=Streptomyces thioluteus TaxID=66431 RepID=UPI0031EC7B2F